MEKMMSLHGCGWIIKEKRRTMIGMNIYKHSPGMKYCSLAVMEKRKRHGCQ